MPDPLAPTPVPLLQDAVLGGQVHVVPLRDAREHVVSLSTACWCAPTVQQETPTSVTSIHRPILPVVRGHTLDLRKVYVVSVEGQDVATELSR